jgi:hypothetical protein
MHIQNIVLNFFHAVLYFEMYEGVSKSFRTGRLERELQMVQLPLGVIVPLFNESV